MNPLRQLGEGFFADAIEDFRLVAKVEIDGSGRVLYFFGDFADGDVLVTFFDE
jgi:hypothetical protein